MHGIITEWTSWHCCNPKFYAKRSYSLYLHGGHPQISSSLMRIHSEIRLQNIPISVSKILIRQ
jgi:hypothetical protein